MYNVLMRTPNSCAQVFEATLGLITVDPHTLQITSTIEEMAKAHDEWARHVQATVPPARLLVHKSADGWEPICKALNYAAPSTSTQGETPSTPLARYTCVYL